MCKSSSVGKFLLLQITVVTNLSDIKWFKKIICQTDLWIFLKLTHFKGPMFYLYKRHSVLAQKWFSHRYWEFV